MRIRKYTEKGTWQNDGRLFVHVAFVASDKVIRCYGWKYEILSEHIDTHIVNKKGIHVFVCATRLMCQCRKVNTYAVAVGFMSQPSFYTNLSSVLRKYLIKETETTKKTPNASWKIHYAHESTEYSMTSFWTNDFTFNSNALHKMKSMIYIVVFVRLFKFQISLIFPNMYRRYEGKIQMIASR